MKFSNPFKKTIVILAISSVGLIIALAASTIKVNSVEGVSYACAKAKKESTREKKCPPVLLKEYYGLPLPSSKLLYASTNSAENKLLVNAQEYPLLQYSYFIFLLNCLFWVAASLLVAKYTIKLLQSNKQEKKTLDENNRN